MLSGQQIADDTNAFSIESVPKQKRLNRTEPRTNHSNMHLQPGKKFKVTCVKIQKNEIIEQLSQDEEATIKQTSNTKERTEASNLTYFMKTNKYNQQSKIITNKLERNQNIST